MEVEIMRAHVRKRYPTKAWAKKVAKMPDDQIIAIYYSFVSRKSPTELLNEQLSNAIAERFNGAVTYHCLACNTTYKRDNPDLTNCEYCNSERIEKK